jgi:hypothetical protein
MQEPRCDFCSTPNAGWTFPARDFESSVIPIRPTETVSLRSAGGWAACTRCKELIEAGDRNGLADRAARLNPSVKKAPLREVREALRQLHDDFWANREGPNWANREGPAVPDDGSGEDPTR